MQLPAQPLAIGKLQLDLPCLIHRFSPELHEADDTIDPGQVDIIVCRRTAIVAKLREVVNWPDCVALPDWLARFCFGSSSPTRKTKELNHEHRKQSKRKHASPLPETYAAAWCPTLTQNSIDSLFAQRAHCLAFVYLFIGPLCNLFIYQAI